MGVVAVGPFLARSAEPRKFGIPVRAMSGRNIAPKEQPADCAIKHRSPDVPVLLVPPGHAPHSILRHRYAPRAAPHCQPVPRTPLQRRWMVTCPFVCCCGAQRAMTGCPRDPVAPTRAPPLRDGYRAHWLLLWHWRADGSSVLRSWC